MTNNKINKLKNLILLYTNTENMTNNKQTAVEWQHIELSKCGYADYSFTKDVLNFY